MKMYREMMDDSVQGGSTQAQSCGAGEKKLCNDVINELYELCRCVKRVGGEHPMKGVYGLLYSWYMPRNEWDATCYMLRYVLWRKLQKRVGEVLNEKKRELYEKRR